MSNPLWSISTTNLDPQKRHHHETIFTIGNGYLATRGAFEEGGSDDRRATFLHGVFDAAPIVTTELANAPDWLPLEVYLNEARFSLESGQVEDFEQSLDLRNGLLTRRVRWRSPAGEVAELVFERFASLADLHLVCLRCRVMPSFSGTVEFRAALNGNVDNEGLAHWLWLEQGRHGQTIYLHNRTRQSGIELALAMRLVSPVGRLLEESFHDEENIPMQALRFAATPGEAVEVEKFVAYVTSRDVQDVVSEAVQCVCQTVDWSTAWEANRRAWEQEWQRSDVVIEGDAEAQLALRFSLFQLLIAAPRQDDRVNIGAKTLSGFGYRGHAFWDTEIFMLPLFTYTAPHIAKNLLNYRYRNLAGARQKAQANGYEGAQFPWESADTGEEVTPTWVPNVADPAKLVRIWTGDIEIHISADIAYAAYQYWQVTGDDDWMIAKGAELVLDTARFWASRAEWNSAAGRYEYNDVIGPDENHEHVNNNAYTNRMAQWNLQTALEVLDWLEAQSTEKVAELTARLDLTAERLAHWREVIEKIYLNVNEDGLIEQFEGFHQQEYVDLVTLEPRQRSVQEIYGIEGANHIQVLKQPDVLMMLFLLRQCYQDEIFQVNYDYYTPRTDHTYGSSLGPSVQAIMACQVGKPDEAYDHFMRAARADLWDVRGNAGDGIHAASAGGVWQAVVFGFAGLRLTAEGWTVRPRLPSHWRRLKFRFFHRGQQHTVELAS